MFCWWGILEWECVNSANSVSNAAAAAAAVGDDDGYHDAANGNEEEEEEVMGQADVDNDDAAQVYGGRGRADTRPSRRAAVAQSSHYHSIECLINNEYSVSCRQDSSGEVYLPFKFVSKYFEVLSSMRFVGYLVRCGFFFVWGQVSWQRCHRSAWNFAWW